MASPAVVVDTFPGLNLADDAVSLGFKGATVAWNVLLDRPGEVRTRPGVTKIKSWTAGPSAAVLGIAAYESHDLTTRQFVVKRFDGTNYVVEAYADTGGAALASVNLGAAADSPLHAARYGTDSAEYLYVAGNGAAIKRWDGSAFTAVAGAPSATLVAVWSTSNRLVANDPGTSLSTLTFSDQGDAETFSNNTVTLTPGDGSGLTGVVAWQNLVFAFKRDKYFVFTGESEQDDGTPIFDYYTVDGHGSLVHPVAGANGVYFYDGESVWITQGDAPKRISQPVDTVLRGITADLFGLHPTELPSLSYSQNRLYVAGATGTSMTYAYDSRFGTWTQETYKGALAFPQDAVTMHTSVGLPYTMFALWYLNGTNFDPFIAKVDLSATTDDGTDIAWQYRLGYVSPAAGQRITLRSVSVWGTGTVSYLTEARGARSSDVADTGASLALGSTEVDKAIHRVSVRGVLFSPELSHSSVPATVSRLEFRFRAPEAQE